MNWWQRFVKFWRIEERQRPTNLTEWVTDIPSSPTRAAMTREASPPPAGRVSLDTAMHYALGTSWTISPPQDSESFWRIHDIDTSHLDNFTPQELLDMLVDISPEISYAVWQFQRLCNPGYTCKVYALESESTEHKAGTKHIRKVFDMLRDQYGSVDVLIGRYYMGAYLRGAFCGELVLDGQARETVDMVAPDPFSIRFRKRSDPLRKEVWQPGQWQNGKFVPLDIPTFRYIPVDPAPASPYGRSLASPALFTAIFSLSLLHDVKRVVMQQGYKRMDIILNTEQAMDSFAYDPQGYDTLGAYIKGAVEAVRAAYRLLQPDEAFIHTDLFEIGTPVGTVDSDSINAIDKIMERLEKQITRALKATQVVLDTGENLNQTDSNRKWEIHAAGVKSLQHHCEAMMESLLGQSLKAVGIQARIEFRFSELRAAEMFRDEQTKAMQIQNARNMYEAGYSSQDESSNYAVNHNADVPEPRKPLTDLEFEQDNNDGNEAFDQGQDERWLEFIKEYRKHEQKLHESLYTRR